MFAVEFNNQDVSQVEIVRAFLLDNSSTLEFDQDLVTKVNKVIGGAKQMLTFE